MDSRYVTYSSTDPYFYDTPTAGADHSWGESVPCLREKLPPGWSRRNRGPWVILTDEGPLPPAGWKVHVSARPARAASVIETTIRACWNLGVPVKTLASRALVTFSQTKYAARSSSGKVLTAYPRDEAILEKLLASLRAELAGEAAPRVVGDLSIPGGPISVRYGAFTEHWVPDEDGRPVPALFRSGSYVPDRRLGAPTSQCEDPLPASVLDALDSEATSDKLDIHDVQLLHRSNAGGVYRAKLGDGRKVILKEARHWSGLDLTEVDAGQRLRHEAAVLKRLAGSGVAPEVVDLVTVGSSDFLIMTDISGETVNVLVGKKHPEIKPDVNPEDFQGYALWANRVALSVERALRILAERGVIHGDLHEANVIWDGQRAVLIDFESATIDGEGIGTGIVAHPIVVSPSAEVDSADARNGTPFMAALKMFRLSLLVPVVGILHWQPELVTDLAQTALSKIPVPATYTLPEGPVGSRMPVEPPTPSRLVQGLLCCASPEREDRLFPGDVAQFEAPRQGLGLGHGAAGVLLALKCAGVAPREDMISWLAHRALAPGPRPRGLWDGADGVVMTLALLGRDAQAQEILALAGQGHSWPVNNPWWARGEAGIALASSEIGLALKRTDLIEFAVASIRSLELTVKQHATPAGYRPGLEQGWAGIAMAALRIAEIAPDLGDKAALVDLATEALERELKSCSWHRRALLAEERHTLLPYLGVGSAGVGLVADALRQVRPDPQWDLVVAGVRRASEISQVFGPELWQGRASLILTLRRLGTTEEVLAEHQRRLGWYVVPAQSLAANSDFVLGSQLRRCSADLATGAAGVLLSCLPDGKDPLHHVLRAPAHRVPSAL